MTTTPTPDGVIPPVTVTLALTVHPEVWAAILGLTAEDPATVAESVVAEATALLMAKATAAASPWLPFASVVRS